MKSKLIILFERIQKLRNDGILMKDIANAIDLPSSVLSTLYKTILPAYIKSLDSKNEEESLNYALSLASNISKKKLLASIDNILESLSSQIATNSLSNQKLQNPFINSLLQETQNFRNLNLKGLYQSYSISSSLDKLKLEPFKFDWSKENNIMNVFRRNAYGALNYGVGLFKDETIFYILLNERDKNMAFVTIYLQIPFYEYPDQIRGLYLTLDLNGNPVARRIVFVHISENTNDDDFSNLNATSIIKDDLSDELMPIWNYCSQKGDYIKMCSLPNVRMDFNDLAKEKEILSI